jgi:signal transduction histidine kinase
VLDGTAEEELRIVAESSGGIDSAVALRAFEPFHGLQAEPEEAAAVLPSYARAGEGLGLALYLARETARAHGGELALDACAENAARFVATLPRRPPP